MERALELPSGFPVRSLSQQLNFPWLPLFVQWIHRRKTQLDAFAKYGRKCPAGDRGDFAIRLFGKEIHFLRLPIDRWTPWTYIRDSQFAALAGHRIGRSAQYLGDVLVMCRAQHSQFILLPRLDWTHELARFLSPNHNRLQRPVEFSGQKRVRNTAQQLELGLCPAAEFGIHRWQAPIRS